MLFVYYRKEMSKDIVTRKKKPAILIDQTAVKLN